MAHSLDPLGLTVVLTQCMSRGAVAPSSLGQEVKGTKAVTSCDGEQGEGCPSQKGPHERAQRRVSWCVPVYLQVLEVPGSMAQSVQAGKEDGAESGQRPWEVGGQEGVWALLAEAGKPQ